MNGIFILVFEICDLNSQCNLRNHSTDPSMNSGHACRTITTKSVVGKAFPMSLCLIGK